MFDVFDLVPVARDRALSLALHASPMLPAVCILKHAHVCRREQVTPYAMGAVLIGHPPCADKLSLAFKTGPVWSNIPLHQSVSPITQFRAIPHATP
jgi:hypothetical protein